VSSTQAQQRSITEPPKEEKKRFLFIYLFWV
jgi:hypothetical protein